MDILDYILLGVLVAAGHRAIGYIIRHKGKCSGDCMGCTKQCKREDEQ